MCPPWQLLTLLWKLYICVSLSFHMTTCFLLRHLRCSDSVIISKRCTAKWKSSELGKKKGSAARETPSLMFKLIYNYVLHCMRTVNGAINTLRWWRCITIVVFQFCRWMRIRQHDRPNDPGRIFSFSVCVYTSVCVCCMYLSLCLSLPGSDMCMQTHCLEGGMTKKTPRSLWAFCFLFFLLLPVLHHWGKLNPNKEETLSVLC